MDKRKIRYLIKTFYRDMLLQIVLITFFMISFALLLQNPKYRQKVTIETDEAGPEAKSSSSSSRKKGKN